MEYGYADNTTYATRNMVMQQTQITREHGIRLYRKTQFREHMGWIHNATLVHRNFKVHVLSPVKMQSLSYKNETTCSSYNTQHESIPEHRLKVPLEEFGYSFFS